MHGVPLHLPDLAAFASVLLSDGALQNCSEHDCTMLYTLLEIHPPLDEALAGLAAQDEHIYVQGQHQDALCFFEVNNHICPCFAFARRSHKGRNA